MRHVDRPPLPVRSRSVRPSVEPLEERRLLSFLQPFGSKFARINSGGVVDVIAVTGPGQVFAKRVAHHAIAITLAGTTQDSQVTVSSLGAHLGTANHPLQVASIQVRTGRLGGFQGSTTVDLQGPITPLIGPTVSLQFDALGPSAQIDVVGNLGQFSVNRSIDLGSAGHINISNDLTGSLSVTRDITLDGGQINIGRDLAGTLNVGGNLTVDDGGLFSVARNLGAAATIIVGGVITTTGGGVTISGNLTLASRGMITVGGNMSALFVIGNLQTFQGGEIQVEKNLGTLSVTGVIQGKGSEDIVVGDDLAQLTVLGGGTGMQGLQGVNIDVAKNIQGIDIRNGIANSLITAGILIDGGTPGTGSNGWNIGPDGFVAVLDSQILAGFEIRNLVIGGDVKSDLPENPTSGRVTRIVAGEDKNGNATTNGVIDNLKILGKLIDAEVSPSATAAAFSA